MKAQEIAKAYDATPRHTETRKASKSRLYEVVGEALGLIACMCVAAIVITITVKFIMWIL